MTAFHNVVIAAAVVAICQYTSAWMSPTGTRTRSGGTPILISCLFTERYSFTTLNAEKPEVTAKHDEGDFLENEVENKPAVEWGVSYIGGDPCGSKLNSDPFDKSPSDKPGLPDDMKARIAVLAQKKLQEERERENQK